MFSCLIYKISEHYNLFRLLKPDELQVEYIIRGISFDRDGSDAQLRDHLNLEQRDATRSPVDSHVCDSPELEVENMKRIIAHITSGIGELSSNYSLLLHETLMARNMHWLGRALRLKHSFGEVMGLKGVTDSLERQKRNLMKSLRKTTTGMCADNIEPKKIVTPSASTTFIEEKKVSDPEDDTKNDQVNASGPDLKTLECEQHSDHKTGQVKEIIMTTDKIGDQKLVPDVPTNFLSPPISQIEPSSPYNSVGGLNLQNQPNQQFNPLIDQYIPSAQHIDRPNIPAYQGFGNAIPPNRFPAHLSRFNEINPYDPYSTGRNNQRNVDYSRIQNNTPNSFNERSIPKWSIKFDGTNKACDIKEFLFRLESMAARENYPVSNLVNIVHRFLEGIAERFYWIFLRGRPNASWDQTKVALLSQFGYPDTDFEIRRKIENRHQRIGESFNDFLLDVQSLNVKLSVKFSDYELLHCLRENMSTNLKERTLASHFNSIEELRSLCQKFERLWSSSSAKGISFPNRGRIASLDMNAGNYPNFNQYYGPEVVDEIMGPQDHIPRWETRSEIQSQDTLTHRALSFNDREVSNMCQRQNSVTPISQMPHVTITEMPYNDPASTNYQISAINHQSYKQHSQNIKGTNLICWNCSDIGHRYQDCPKEFLEVFCFGCGNRGVRKPNCFFCKKRTMENFSPNVMKSGMTVRSDQVVSHLKPMMEEAASNTEPNNKYK